MTRISRNQEKDFLKDSAWNVAVLSQVFGLTASNSEDTAIHSKEDILHPAQITSSLLRQVMAAGEWKLAAKAKIVQYAIEGQVAKFIDQDSGEAVSYDLDFDMVHDMIDYLEGQHRSEPDFDGHISSIVCRAIACMQSEALGGEACDSLIDRVSVENRGACEAQLRQCIERVAPLSESRTEVEGHALKEIKAALDALKETVPKISKGGLAGLLGMKKVDTRAVKEIDAINVRDILESIGGTMITDEQEALDALKGEILNALSDDVKSKVNLDHANVEQHLNKVVPHCASMKEILKKAPIR